LTGSVLIKGGTVLSLDRGVGNMVAGDVLVEDGVVVEVGTSVRARKAETVDASNAIVMPGFVDTHRHVWHSLFRNIGGAPDGVSPATVGPHYTSEHVYAATLIGLLGAVEAGISTVVDWADISSESAFIEAALQAHVDSGLRTVYVQARTDWARNAAEPDPRSTEGVGGPRTTLALGSRALQPDGLDAAAADWARARSEGIRIHAHAGIEPGSGGVVARAGDAGLLGEDVTLIHCTHLDERDLDAVESSGVSVALTPSYEMTAGLGSPPLQGLIDRGVRPGLGVGSEMEAPGDMFAQMRAANSVQHATLFDLKLAGKGGVPNLLGTRDVIQYGTVDGARVAGLGAVTGSLTPGRRGDIVVLRTDRPNIAPVNDPIGAVVWGMDTSNVDWLFVDGVALVRDGTLTADIGRAQQLAVSAQTEVANAAGLLSYAGAKES
jgi:cytosine/adenosine deaminase-related metal-dependent hydrolase